MALFTLKRSKHRLTASKTIRTLKKVVMVASVYYVTIQRFKTLPIAPAQLLIYFLEPFTLQTNSKALTIKRNESTPKKVFIYSSLMVMGNGIYNVDSKK